MNLTTYCIHCNKPEGVCVRINRYTPKQEIRIADDPQVPPLTQEDIRRIVREIVREEIKKFGITNTEGAEA